MRWGAKMVEGAQERLAELISREQQGFRAMLRAGIALFLLLLVIVTAVAVFSMRVSKRTSEALLESRRNAFETRVALNEQNTRIADQEARIRRAAIEIRDLAQSNGGAIGPKQLEEARAALLGFIQRGEPLSITDEATITRIGATQQDSPVGRYMSGVSALIQFQNSGAPLEQDGKTPPEITAAMQKLQQAASEDPSLAPMALTAVAHIRSRAAVASSYDPKACDALYAALDAAAAGGASGPPLLTWRADCERKTGRSREAFLHFTQALLQVEAAKAQSAQNQTMRPNAPPSEFEISALHGIGTTLIRESAFQGGDAEMQDAIQVARKACPGGQAGYSPAMGLALACLDAAIAKRKLAGQTASQINGTAENKGFAFFRDDKFADAFRNAEPIAANAPSAWNELVRVIAADHLLKADDKSVHEEAKMARAAALDNVSFFKVDSFNSCELKSLFSEPLYNEAIGILARTHPKVPPARIDCAKA